MSVLGMKCNKLGRNSEQDSTSNLYLTDWIKNITVNQYSSQREIEKKIDNRALG